MLGNAEFHAGNCDSADEQARDRGAHLSSGMSGTHWPMPAPGGVTDHATGAPRAAERHAGGIGAEKGAIPERALGHRDASEHWRPQGARASPPAVSWQIEVDRSRRPAGAQAAQAGAQGIPRASLLTQKPPNSSLKSDRPIDESPGRHTDSKSDSSPPASTSLAPGCHGTLQSALPPAQRPKPRPLPPLPDFMSLDTTRSPSYSQDMPRMEALYAATALASAVMDKPPRAAAPKSYHGVGGQAAEGDSTVMLSQHSGAAAQSASRLQPEGGSEGVRPACEGMMREANSSKQPGSTEQPDQAPIMRPGKAQQALAAPLSGAQHEAALTSMPGAAVSDTCESQHCSTGARADKSMTKFSGIAGTDLPGEHTSLAAHSLHQHPDTAGSSSGNGESELRDRSPKLQVDYRAAAQSCEYGSIKASLRTLQALLDNTECHASTSDHTEDTETGSRLDRAEVQRADELGNATQAAAAASKEKQSDSQPSKDAPPALRADSELLQEGPSSTSHASQQQGQHIGCMTQSVHQENVALPNDKQAPAVRRTDVERGQSRCENQQVSMHCTDIAMASQESVHVT